LGKTDDDFGGARNLRELRGKSRMRRHVNMWEDTIKMVIEERAGNLRTEFIGLRMGTTDSLVSLILNPLTPQKAKNFLITLTNINV